MRKGELNKVQELQQLLGRKLRLHAEAELEIELNVEKEKVLCDFLLHQEFFGHLSAALAKYVNSAVNEAAGRDAATTLQDLVWAGTAADALSTDKDPTWLHQQLPDSYVARLLRQSSLQQVHQVLQMTPQDWVDFWTDTSQQLLLLLEICSRSEYDYDPHSTTAAALVSASSSAEDAVVATASREAPSAAGSCCPSAAAQQQRWSVQQQPLHTSAAANRKLLWQTVDSKLQLVNLALVLDSVPYLSVIGVCLASGAGGQPSREHWEAVADRLQLSPMQEAHLSICITEYKRMQAATRSEGVNLLQTAQQPTLQVAAALQQQQQQQQHDSEQQQQCDGHSSRSSCTAQGLQQAGAQEAMTGQQQASAMWPADATQHTAYYHSGLAQQFSNHVAKRQLQQLCAHAVILNTLTRHQVAVITVASFPYTPASFTVAEIVCSRLQQRTQEQLREVEEGASRKSSAASQNPVSGGQPGAGKARACAAADGDLSGQGSKRVPYSHWLREHHDQERAAELLLHQHHCWSQLGRLKHPSKTPEQQ